MLKRNPTFCHCCRIINTVSEYSVITYKYTTSSARVVNYILVIANSSPLAHNIQYNYTFFTDLIFFLIFLGQWNKCCHSMFYVTSFSHPTRYTGMSIVYTLLKYSVVHLSLSKIKYFRKKFTKNCTKYLATTKID